MTNSPNPKEDCGCSKKEQDETKEMDDCPEGQTWNADTHQCEAKEMDDCPPGQHHNDAGDCVADESKKAIVIDEVPKWASTLQDQLKSLEARIGIKTETTKPKPLPTARVANQANDEFLSIQKIAEKLPKHLKEYGRFEIDIPVDYIRSFNTHMVKTSNGLREAYKTNEEPRTLKEAVTISGTHATQDLDTDVALVPGGISFQPVFQFAKFKQIGQGMDRARFFKTDLPANEDQTAASTANQGTQTLTSVEVVPSQIRGVYLIADSDEVENSPFDLVNAIVTASAASYDDYIATDMLDTKSREGTLNAGRWIRGDDGTVITTSDTASVALDEDGIFAGREYLENQGYLRGGVKPVVFLDPQQWRELVTSSEVTNLATRSIPSIWTDATLNTFAGCEIVVTNAVQHKSDQTNASIGAIMCVPKHSYGIASRRSVTVKFHEVPEDNTTRITTNYRVISGVIDATSIVRISTTD
jgi:hypothetical protein